MHPDIGENMPQEVKMNPEKAQLIVASSSVHKIKEIREILKSFDFEILSMAQVGLGDLDIEENGSSFEENAEIKAREVFERMGGKVMTLADDSGLEVDYLNGAPGIYSARFSGMPRSDARNNEKLLEALSGVPSEKRGAQFVSALVLMMPDRNPIVVRGTIRGVILEAPAGEKGFGYDPLFYMPELDKTLAQMSETEKNQNSHRSKALAALKERLEIDL